MQEIQSALLDWDILEGGVCETQRKVITLGWASVLVDRWMEEAERKSSKSNPSSSMFCKLDFNISSSSVVNFTLAVLDMTSRCCHNTHLLPLNCCQNNNPYTIKVHEHFVLKLCKQVNYQNKSIQNCR